MCSPEAGRAWRHEAQADAAAERMKCVSCGKCRQVCPVFRHTGRESWSARGRVTLAEALAREDQPFSQGLSEALSACLLCGSCVMACPGGVRVDKIVLAARAQLVARGDVALYKKLMAGFFASPPLLRVAAGLTPLVSRILTRSDSSRPGRSFRFPWGPFAGRALPRGESLAQELGPPVRLAGAQGEHRQVHFFPGCLTTMLDPDLPERLNRLLARGGVSMRSLDGGECCSLPIMAVGMADEARANVDRQLAEWESRGVTKRPLLVVCASCASTLRDYYPWYASRRLRQVADGVARVVRDASSFVLEQSLVPDNPLPGMGKVAYHDPCHYRHSHGLQDSNRDLLRAYGYLPVEPPGGGDCCGFGGSFSLTNWDVSSAVGRARARALASTGALLAATPCPGCRLQLVGAMVSLTAGPVQRVEHPLTLVCKGQASSIHKLEN